MPSLPPFRPRDLQTLATEIKEQRERTRALEVAVVERRLESRRLKELRLTKIAVEKEEKRQRRIIEVNQRVKLDIERRRALSIQQGDQRQWSEGKELDEICKRGSVEMESVVQ